MHKVCIFHELGGILLALFSIELIIVSIVALVFLFVSVYKSWSNTEEIKKELQEIKELLKQKDTKN
ncbi:hypothetical protein TTE2756 [Caldanaerobacter subterraneus subsp. tengcongensis MB4]|uniref:DUF4083 domain-containing protein n=1 Tax=Caldanaerobacter subterraneus subsp. tengcongensis (strain DSM 15242 / JCM 11007 / NBRC 100824 / MB4) TaxID=273068 RepID=Q8R6P2_CALS4|nr:hypothetical protein TTE2756 [Caldanaerobacter subterraneus subsp. tengcongensis MB4]